MNKQVKWGVAISDNPTGPFVKSQYNPITNTGHEIMAWPYADGMAILQHQDGPEALTIQYAEDGMNFDIMGNVTDGFPEAAGLGRAEKSNTNPHAGVKWGVGHQLNWGNNTNGGWMYIYRFDKVGTDVNGSVFSGKVTDSANQPLSGVSISVNGNSQTTTTDDQGEWSIALGSNKATLIFNKEGYEEGTLNNKNAGNNLNISLTKEAEPIIFSGKITDVNGQVLSGVQVLDVNNNTTTTTDAAGAWSMSLGTSEKVTLVFHKEGFTYEQVVNYEAGSDINITLREAIKSSATLRNEYYAEYGCNTVSIPNDKNWNVEFEITELKGDLAPNYKYIRRDPSAVLTVGDTYYIWYSYSKSKSDDGSFNNDAEINSKKASWDLNDLYYATSTDGITWKEKGAAVVRGAAGSYDHRSVFTCEILQDNGKYYLVYQCAADEDGIYNRNTVGMSWANSPDGPWIKLDEPVLYPTYTNDIFFDNNAVHDPCIIPYKGKYYLYYKGECNCRDNQGCKNWCNPICDLSKQVKWGVAISDNPTGPFVKSQYNPITNTGHEVSVWPFASGMVILQHKDGPEPNTIQYAPDGMNFDIMGKVETFAVQWEGLFNGFPEAAGLARTTKSNTNPHADIKWGVGHQLNWGNNTDGGWMYIYRFDKKSADTSVDMDVTTGSQEDAASQSSIEIFPNPADNTLNIEGEFNSWEINSMEGVFFKSGSEKTIDISALPEALYVISFDGINSKVFSKK